MPSPLQIPKTFSADPETQRRELERTTQEIDRYLRDSVLSAGQLGAIKQLNPVALSFGFIARVNVADGDTLILKLPRANALNIGKRCTVRRGSTTGEVLIYAVDCLVGGAERYRMANDIHFVEFLFDGDYYPSRAGGGS